MHFVPAAELPRDGVEAKSDSLAEKVAEVLDWGLGRLGRNYLDGLEWRRGRLRRDYLGGFDWRLRARGSVGSVLIVDGSFPSNAARASTPAFGAA